MFESLKVYIHVGLPKTATTTLQNHFLTLMDNFNLIGQPLSNQNLSIQEIIHTITDCESIEYDESQLAKKISNHITQNKLILSEESFSIGSSLLGRVSRLEITRRLKRLFPNAKILLTLREQKSIIKSFYLQKRKVDINFNQSFNQWFEYNKSIMYKQNIFNYFFYDKTIKMYEDEFGKENIKILLFEEFLSNQKKYFENIYDFLETRNCNYFHNIEHKNNTVTHGQILVNKLSPILRGLISKSPLRLKVYLKDFISSHGTVIVNMSEKQKFFVNELYKKSNLNVQKNYGLNLSKYNYNVDI